MREAGFTTYTIDHEHNRHRPKVALILADLTQEHSQQTAVDMVRQLRPLSIHLGLPCGTCSRARERELPEHLRSQHSAPPPLRSAEHLMGMPGLVGTNLAKVQAANTLYYFGVQLLFLCFELDILVSVENPARSWLWGILTKLVAAINNAEFTKWYAALTSTDFHACMHGGERNKRTRLLASQGLYDELAAECDNSHQHKPWFVVKRGSGLEFATALEAEYPRVLSTRYGSMLEKTGRTAALALGSPSFFSSKGKTCMGGPNLQSQTPNSRVSKVFIILM